jgi:hypothetical protein
MRRALAILKYVPAVLCGLLVVAWFAGGFVELGFAFTCPRPWSSRFNRVVVIGGGSIQWDYRDRSEGFFMDELGQLDKRDALLRFGGRFEFHQYQGDSYPYDASIPISWIVTGLLPLSVGILNRFRFPLWSYFAWTALVAAELAYYLR